MDQERLTPDSGNSGQIMVPIDWWLDALTKGIDEEKPIKRKRSTQVELLQKLYSEIDKRKSKIVGLYVNGKLSPPSKSHQKQIDRLRGVIGRVLNLEGFRGIAEDFVEHIHFYHNPDSRSQFFEMLHEGFSEEFRDERLALLQKWETPPNPNDYLNEMPIDVRNLIPLYVSLNMTGRSKVIPPEFQLDKLG